MKYILLTVIVMTLTVVISIKLAMVLLVAGGFIVLFGVGAAASCAMSIRKGSTTDDNSPLAQAIWGPKDAN